MAHLRSRALLDSQLLLVVAGWLVSQVHIYRPRPLGLTGKHSLLNPGPRDRLAQSRLLVPAVLTAVWPCHRLVVCDSAPLSTMDIRPVAVYPQSR